MRTPLTGWAYCDTDPRDGPRRCVRERYEHRHGLGWWRGDERFGQYFQSAQLLYAAGLRCVIFQRPGQQRSWELRLRRRRAPYAVTVNFGFNMETEQGEMAPHLVNVGERLTPSPKTTREKSRSIFPLGLVGNPLATPRCSLARRDPEAPTDHVSARYPGRHRLPGLLYSVGPGAAGPFALFNVVPEPGRPGEFAFNPIAGASWCSTGGGAHPPWERRTSRRRRPRGPMCTAVVVDVLR